MGIRVSKRVPLILHIWHGGVRCTRMTGALTGGVPQVTSPAGFCCPGYGVLTLPCPPRVPPSKSPSFRLLKGSNPIIDVRENGIQAQASRKRYVTAHHLERLLSVLVLSGFSHEKSRPPTAA